MRVREHVVGVLLLTGIGIAILIATGSGSDAGVFFGGALIELPFLAAAWLKAKRTALA